MQDSLENARYSALMRMAWILAADVVGYSRQMECQEISERT